MATLAERSSSPESLSGDAVHEPHLRRQPLPSFDWLFDVDLLSPTPEPTPHMSPEGSLNDDNFIDLTGDSSPRPAPRARSQLTPRSDQEPERKRRRVAEDRSNQPSSSSSHQHSRPVVQPRAELAQQRTAGDTVDEVDLTRVEDDADLKRHQEEQAKRRKAVEEQQQQLLNESIASQNPTTSSSTLSHLSCIICMETMTDLTATHCGENQGAEPGKGRSRCPVCREKVSRKPHGRKQAEVIPLELKLKIRSEKAKGKQRENEEFADPPIGD